MEYLHKLSNENIVPSEQNEMKNINIIPKNAQSYGESNKFIIKFQDQIIFALFFLDIGAIIFTIKFTHEILKDIFLSICAFFTVISLIILPHRIVLLKDTLNKKVLVKVMNYLCFSKKRFKIDLEKIHFYINEEKHKSDSGLSLSYQLFIINDDYKNLVGIDLVKNHPIKLKPGKFIYFFEQFCLGKYNYIQFNKILNDFSSSID